MNHTGMSATAMFGDPEPGTPEAVQAAWQRKRPGHSVNAAQIGAQLASEAMRASDPERALGALLDLATSAARAKLREAMRRDVAQDARRAGL